MDDAGSNKVAAAILTAGMMQKNSWTPTQDKYVEVYQQFLWNLDEIDKKKSDKRTEEQIAGLKELNR